MKSDKFLEKNLDNECTCTGVWWVPRSPRDTVPECAHRHSGTLVYSPINGMRLIVQDQLELEEDRDQMIGSLIGSRLATVWGISTGKEHITLFDSTNLGAPQDAGVDVPATLYKPCIMLVNNQKKWFTSFKDVAFEGLDLAYTHLNEWVGISGLSSSSAGARDMGGDTIISYRQPPPLPPADVGDYIIEILPTSSYKSAPFTVTLGQRASFSIKPKKGDINLDELKKLVTGVRNFMSLVTGEHIAPLTITGALKDETGHIVLARVMYKEVGVTQYSKNVSRYEMLFPYEKISKTFDKALKKVLFDEKMKTVYDQFFARL